MPVSKPLRRVAVLIETSNSWGRDVIRGIHGFNERRRPWELFIAPPGNHGRLSIPRGWEGDGVIARVGSQPMLKELQSLALPVVNVSAIELSGLNFPRVQHDTCLGAQMAAQYFLERGFKNFAYFSLFGLSYVGKHETAFRNEVVPHNYRLYSVKAQTRDEPDWNLDQNQLIGWLKSLPKPVGLLTWNANCGRRIVYACQGAGLRIPEDIALLSGADDNLFCELSHIPISAIRVGCEQIGKQAASILDRLIQGKAAPLKPVLIPPTSVISRHSTDLIPLAEETVVRAMRFIQANAGNPIQVTDVARQSGVARRVLERRFMAQLARSPAMEIRRAHLERARQLLAETDRPMREVARNSGFGSPEYMASLFKTELGLTPLDYRKRFQSMK